MRGLQVWLDGAAYGRPKVFSGSSLRLIDSRIWSQALPVLSLCMPRWWLEWFGRVRKEFARQQVRAAF